MSPPTRTLRSLLPTTLAVLSREESGGSDRTIRFLASTPNVARDGGIVDVEGWDTDDFMRSHPVFLWSHQSDREPLGKATRLVRQKDGLVIDVEFAGPEQRHDFADRIFRLYKFGALRAVSVGFRVLEEREPTPEERERGARWVASKALLLELSAVAVPADPGAVAKGAFSKSDYATLKSQFGEIDGWAPVLRSIESSLEATPVEQPAHTPTTTIPALGTTASSTSSREEAVALLAELHDLLARASECIAELAAQAGRGSANTTSGSSSVEVRVTPSVELPSTDAVAPVQEAPAAGPVEVNHLDSCASDLDAARILRALAKWGVKSNGVIED
jgi:HK97 family phage prohead protease